LAADLLEAIRLEVGSPVLDAARPSAHLFATQPLLLAQTTLFSLRPAGSKAVLDASAVHLMINSLRFWHAYYETFFELITLEVSVEGQPRIWLQACSKHSSDFNGNSSPFRDR